MRIVLNFDNNITYAPEFFAKLTHSLKNDEIIIMSNQENPEELETILNEYGIRYDRLFFTNDPHCPCSPDQKLEEWKAKAAEQMKPEVWFEEMPETIPLLPSPTKVFMACDEIIQKWLQQRLKKK